MSDPTMWAMRALLYMLVPVVFGPVLEFVVNLYSPVPARVLVNESFQVIQHRRPRLFVPEVLLGRFGIWYRLAIWPLWFVNLCLMVAAEAREARKALR